ncbi:uncharacterized protein THITE_2109181 [Thermothielavioides terrestris NRRL 8126]|uniref:Uncharacterized protein n=1 Tax=Thermothielavioides terrestris (strain ATCC 38088 / NRRL 8126) TaxID=578455 RepID=G2QTY9_THETT|nr:uncharacterized protein THITE_2109181 [Thermothielavioides terrestris NRRL 8126]AEO63648.1 hypothetical protein THITE_2109181 [Thermothielavioides terrestris NRRL 8126]
MKNAILIAAAVGLAAALPQPGAPLTRRGGTRPPHHSAPRRNTTYPEYSSNWAGAVQIGTGFTFVTGTITVPSVYNGNPYSAASAWVGIDGDTCQTAILQTGVSFYGDGSYDAWYEWIPDYSYSFSGFGLRAGDEIRMTVDATSKTTGVATLENLSTGAKVSHTFRNTPSTLCETNAEWIVEDFESGGSLVPFADFGTVTFTDAYATGSGGQVTPQGATIIDIRQSGRVLTNCGTSGADLTCTYTG